MLVYSRCGRISPARSLLHQRFGSGPGHVFAHWPGPLFACVFSLAQVVNLYNPENEPTRAAQRSFFCAEHNITPKPMQSALAAPPIRLGCLVATESAQDMKKQYYTTKEAADLVGASSQIIRTYTDRYARYFSTEATPPAGQARRFTEADVRLIAFIYDRTSGRRLTHDDVMEQLEEGQLETFEWEPEEPQEAPGDATGGEESSTAALVPIEHLNAARALLEDARAREQSAKDEADALRDRIETLQRELGEAQGELSAYKRLQPKRPAWWRWLFGGADE